MLIKASRIASLSLVACTSSPSPNTNDNGPMPGVQNNVTATGVVTSAPDPVNTSLGSPIGAIGSTSWMEVRYEQQPPIWVEGKPDVTSYHFGRADLAFPTKSTNVVLALTGIDWHMGDNMQLVTPNTGLSIHDLDTRFPYPGDGAKAISGAWLDWAKVDASLPDASKGDVTWLAQMSLKPSISGSTYTVLTHAGAANNFTVTDGATTTLSAELAPVALDRTLTLRWKGSAYAALAAQAGANVGPAPAPIIKLQTLPKPLAANSNAFGRYYFYMPSLVEWGPVSGTADLAEPIRYGNPFTSTAAPWTEFVTMVYPMPVHVPGVGGTVAFMVQATPVSALASGEIAPAITPVRNVRVNGLTADTVRTGVGATPTITWEAPATGEPTSYAITVRGIQNVGPGKTITALGTFRTHAMSLTLPTFATSSVSSYLLTITAIASGEHDLTTKPLIGSLPYASADYVTAQLAR